jgi:hypothetical protein
VPGSKERVRAFSFNNTLLLLTAGIGEPYDPATGKGVVGKNYCQQTNSGVMLFVEDEINPFIGTGSSPAAIDDFQGDNFDHAGLGFFGGGFIAAVVSGGRPIQVRPVPPGTPRWGSAWKEATVRWYNHAFPLNAHGINYAHGADQRGQWRLEGRAGHAHRWVRRGLVCQRRPAAPAGRPGREFPCRLRNSIHRSSG